MNVLLLNGSPRPNGCTARALREVADTLKPKASTSTPSKSASSQYADA